MEIIICGRSAAVHGLRIRTWNGLFRRGNLQPFVSIGCQSTADPVSRAFEFLVYLCETPWICSLMWILDSVTNEALNLKIPHSN